MTCWLAIALAAAAGACLGSAAVTWAMRGSRGSPFAAGRSSCDSCASPLGYAQTLPLISYLRLRGRCGACGAPISRLHLVGELIGAALLFQLCLRGVSAATLIEVGLGLALLASSSVDALTMRLPDALTAICASAGAGLAQLQGGERLAEGVVAAAISGGLMMGLRLLFERLRGDPGLGSGDVKLVAALALWLGAATPLWIGAACVAALAGRGLARTSSERFSFGPYLAATGWLLGVLQDRVGRLG